MVMKTLLEKINDEYDALDPEDNSGHVWWNKFREFVNEHQFQIWLHTFYMKTIYDDLWVHREYRGRVYTTDQLKGVYLVGKPANPY